MPEVLLNRSEQIRPKLEHDNYGIYLFCVPKRLITAFDRENRAFEY